MSSGHFLTKCLENYTKGVKMLQGKEKPISEIREHLLQFTGGSINMCKQNGLALVTLNHPAKKNAISGKMMADLQDVVEDLEQWKEGKGVLLKGTNGTFCSGGDLDFARATATPEQGLMMSTFMNHVLDKFQALPLVSVALVEGAGALGGGAELSVACDFRLIAPSAKGIGFVHPRMGIVPAWGGSRRLVKAVGYRTALDILCSGRILDPVECKALGLVDEVTPPDTDPTEYAVTWLKSRTRYDSDIIRVIKSSCCIARDLSHELEPERRMFAPLWGGPLNLEALANNIKHKD